MNPPPATDAQGLRSVSMTATTPFASGEVLTEGVGAPPEDVAPGESDGDAEVALPPAVVGLTGGDGGSRGAPPPEPHAAATIAATTTAPNSRNLPERTRSIAVLLASNDISVRGTLGISGRAALPGSCSFSAVR